MGAATRPFKASSDAAPQRLGYPDHSEPEGAASMITTTTDGVDGKQVTQYLGVVSGEAIMGTNIFRDMFASVRDVVGGRSGGYEKALKEGKDTAMQDMIEEAQLLGADAIVGIDLDYEVIGGDKRTLLMVSANGTAVKLG